MIIHHVALLLPYLIVNRLPDQPVAAVHQTVVADRFLKIRFDIRADDVRMEAVRLLLARIDNPSAPSEHAVLPAHMVVRASTGIEE